MLLLKQEHFDRECAARFYDQFGTCIISFIQRDNAKPEGMSHKAKRVALTTLHTKIKCTREGGMALIQ